MPDDPRGGACADGESLLVTGHIAHVVQPVLDEPAGTDVPGQLFGAGWLGCQTGDAVGEPLAGALTVQSAEVAAGSQRLGGIREVDAALAGDRRDPGGALCGTSVPQAKTTCSGRKPR